MNTFVIIGFDDTKEIIADEAFMLGVKKVYLLSRPQIKYTYENEKVELITEENIYQLYNRLDLDNLDENVIFVDCRKMYKNYFEVMYAINTGRFNKRSYYICNDRNIELKNYELISHFNPWTGETLPDNLPEDIKNTIMSMFTTIGKIIKHYLQSGFYEEKIYSIPPGWMMNLSTPELQHIISYYELKPNAPDVHMNLEFVHNSQFRKILTEILVKVSANFLTRNRFISGSVSNWFEPSLWVNY